MLDLLVIGAGLSGLTAALLAATAGRSVRVIAKGLGAPMWSAGTLDLLGYLPDHTPVRSPGAGIPQLPANHPLRQVGAVTAMRAVRDLVGMLTAAGLEYSTHAQDENLVLPSAAGSARPVFAAPTAQLGGRLDDPAPMLIVGFVGLRDFFPYLIAQNLQRQGHTVRAVQLPLRLLTDRHDANTVHLAHALETPVRRHALAAALREQVAQGERIGMPALLGVEQHTTVWAEIQEAIGAPLFEIPMLPPSVPGMRLIHTLRRRLAELGIRVELNMEAVSFSASHGRIEWVASATRARPLRHQARAYLLATGGILGGGFRSSPNGALRETLFDLPLLAPPGREHWFATSFLDPAGHPLFSSGVTVNEAWQPCDEQGAPLFANLWAAGNLLAHADTIRTRSHEGLAVATAHTAVTAYLAHAAIPGVMPAPV